MAEYAEYIARYYASHVDIPKGNYDGEILTELIRCKDCKYSSPNQVYGCRIESFADDLDERMYSNDYCSCAVRKEE